MLKAKLFGTPQITLHNQALSSALTGRKLALLSYLLVTEKPCDRALLADLLWSDLPEPQARKNLRNLLYSLRQLLNEQLVITNTTLTLNPAQRYWTDVQAFTRYMTTEFPPTTAESLSEVLKLYQGEFLTGVAIQDAPRFEVWLTTQRAYFQDQALQGWHWLGDYYLERQEYPAGLAVTRQALTWAPWCETSHRQQMLLLAASGRQQEALAQYESCRQMLADEFNADPLPATTVLYQQIKSQRWQKPAPQPRNAGPLTPARPALPVNWSAIPQQPHFYGRTAELNAVTHWLDREQSPLIFVVGLPGQGKTALLAELVCRLAEAAQEQAESGNGGQAVAATPSAPRFDQILWYSVAGASSFAQMIDDWLQHLAPPAVTETASAPPGGRAPTLERQLTTLLDALRKQRCLLILDQAEALLAQDAQRSAYQPAYAHFGEFLRRICTNQHTSAVILSSRIEGQEFAGLRQRYSAVRSLSLLGLSTAAGITLLHKQGMTDHDAALQTVVEQVAGHPLALLEMAELCRTVAVRNLAGLFANGQASFGALYHKLQQQFQQLTAAEQALLIWLTYVREPVALESLWRHLPSSSLRVPAVEALHLLRCQALVLLNRQANTIALPPVVLMAMTRQVVDLLLAEMHQLYRQLYAPENAGWSAHRQNDQWPEDRRAWLLAGGAPVAPFYHPNGRHGAIGHAAQDNHAVAFLPQPGPYPARPQPDHFPPALTKPRYLNRYPLVTPHATAAVQKEQRDCLVEPLRAHLQEQWGDAETQRFLQDLLTVAERTQPVTDGHLVENLRQLLFPPPQFDGQ